MVRVSKSPEIRKQELIDIALSLFIKEGYEAVSVRDILKVAKGQPGMFYYYFASKQEIYKEAMHQLIQKELEIRTKIISNKSIPVLVRTKELIGEIQESIINSYKAFSDVESFAYQTAVSLELLTAMAKPVSELIMELYNDGIIPAESNLTEQKSYSMALFCIHGSYGVVHANKLDGSSILDNQQFLMPFITKLLGISEGLLD